MVKVGEPSFHFPSANSHAGVVVRAVALTEDADLWLETQKPKQAGDSQQPGGRRK
jgi:hypothetical protein